MLTAQQDSLYYLVHTSDNQASCMLKKFTNIWSKLNLHSTIPELLRSNQAMSPFHEACHMNEVIRGYLSGYKIASLLARRVLASLSRWPNLSSSPPPSPFAVAIVLLKTIRASSGSRVSEGGAC